MKNDHDGAAAAANRSTPRGSTHPIKRRTMLHPGVHYATQTNEDTGEATPLYLNSHEEIDAEIDQRIRLDRASGHAERTADHEAKRANFHADLDAGAQRAPRLELLAVTRAMANRAAREDHVRQETNHAAGVARRRIGGGR